MDGSRPTSARRRVIGIAGSYGGLNLGDEAILTVAISELRSAMPGVELVVFSRNVADTQTRHEVDRVVPAREAMRAEVQSEVERLDLMLLGGGGILYDREAESYLHVTRIAQQVGVPTATYAIGVGPLERRSERQDVVEVLNRMRFVTVRDTRPSGCWSRSASTGRLRRRPIRRSRSSGCRSRCLGSSGKGSARSGIWWECRYT